jgi:hypothetical protein
MWFLLFLAALTDKNVAIRPEATKRFFIVCSFPKYGFVMFMVEICRIPDA